MCATDRRTMTIREIVAADYRTATVFERHGIDFCCRGGRTLEDGCRDAGVDATEILRELEAVTSTQGDGGPRFDAWDLDTLVAYIVANHHAYVRQQLPVLVAHTQKIATVHAARHPELARVAHLLQEIADEMTSHMAKEEQVLFPYIVALVVAVTDRLPAPSAPFGTITNPIHRMEAEHESAGRAMIEIRELTAGFVRPGDACETYAVSLRELEAFERDLHAHVHLENNILFPKAAALEAASRQRLAIASKSL